MPDTRTDRALSRRHPDLRRASDTYDVLADPKTPLGKRAFLLAALLLT